MRIEVVRPGDLGSAELQRWRGFQRSSRSLGNPFLSPEFALAVARARPQAGVAVLRQGAEIGGFLPFERNRLGVGQAIGLGLNDCQGVVHAPGLVWDVPEVLRAAGMSVFEFDNLLAGQAPFAPYHAFQVPNPVMDLSGGFDAFLARVRGRSASFAKEMAYKKRRLGRDLGPVRYEFDSQDRAELDVVLGWKSDQYRRTGRTDRFARGWIVDLVRELAGTRSDGFSGVVSMLYAGDRPVAGHFGLRLHGVLAGWFPAYDPELHRYSPGLVHHVEMAAAAAAAGIERVSMGRGGGSTPYKQVLADHTDQLAEGRVMRAGPAAGLHWAGRVPIRYARRVVTENRTLYRAADRVLVGIARGRAAVDERLRGATP